MSGIPGARSSAPDDAARDAFEPPEHHRDGGMSLVEILVAVVLLGTAGVAVLGAMATSARSSAINRSQAAAVVWLQSAADYMAKTEWVACTGAGAEPAVQASYDAQLQHIVPVDPADPVAPASPAAWPQANLTIGGPVLFWDGTAFAPTCNPTTRLQQLTLRVQNPAGDFTDTIVVVKSNG